MSYPETDKTRTIVEIDGSKHRWDALTGRWRCESNWVCWATDAYMAEMLATDGARYWNISPEVKRKPKLNLRTRILAGVG